MSVSFVLFTSLVIIISLVVVVYLLVLAVDYLNKILEVLIKLNNKK